MRKIESNVNRIKGELNRYYSKCISVGRADELWRAPVLKQLVAVQKECPFEYIRFHGIFHEEMNVVRRNSEGKLEFCFLYTDMLFDTLLEHGLRPVCELGLMPDAMASEEKYVFWWKMNISMPRDMAEWEMLIEAFTAHLTERYGAEEIKKWYFEVWNEPNHPNFFTEYQSPEAYFKLYETAVRAIKRINAEYKVGGPATAGMGWIKETVEHCKSQGTPLDFITSHSYGIKGDFDPDGKAITVIKDINKIPKEMQAYGSLCHKNGIPFIVTEWSSSYSHTDPIHDHYFSAPYHLNVLKRSEGYADMLSYWVFTDIFEENSPPVKPFHGGFGFINVQGVPKPIYHVYTFLHKLGKTELECCDENAYVCKSQNSVQVLLWNLSLKSEKTNTKEYFAGDIPCESTGETQISIGGFEANRACTVRRTTIGKNSGDPFSLYKTGAYGNLATKEQVKALIADSAPKKELSRASTNELGTLEITLEQYENQVDLIEIEF